MNFIVTAKSIYFKIFINLKLKFENFQIELKPYENKTILAKLDV